MFRKILLMIFAFVLAGWAVPAYSDPGQPTFSPAIWGDGELWGTKATTELPTPRGDNLASFDKLFVIVNSNNPEEQLPVAEAAPGNPDYNGGRWYTHTVEWTASGFADHGTVPILTSYAEVQLHAELGHLMITAGALDSSTPDFFVCPLLPVK